jgi:hypothetical protein
MPIPKIKEGESEKDFIPRCVRSIIDEYDQNQALGICYSQLRQKMSESEEKFVLTPRKNENRGAYLTRCSRNAKMKSQSPNLKERMADCLNAFNAYYKYWAKIEEFGDIPKDSVLGMCITKEKARGLSYQEAYARCATKSVSPNVAVVLAEVMDIYGFKPKHFDICPGAQELFKHFVEMPLEDDTIGMVRSAALIADTIFEMEKESIETESATQEMVDEASILLQDFKDIIHEIDEETGMVHDVSFMDGHIVKIKEYLYDDLIEEPVEF